MLKNAPALEGFKNPGFISLSILKTFSVIRQNVILFLFFSLLTTAASHCIYHTPEAIKHSPLLKILFYIVIWLALTIILNLQRIIYFAILSEKSLSLIVAFKKSFSKQDIIDLM